tara:strand:- start:4077 stop:4508 length:432 start_codon:yes stop_codon:yes gene_type:complete
MNELPKYHINVFETASKSDAIIRGLIESGEMTIENIITEIIKQENISLRLQSTVNGIKLKSKIQELTIEPMPFKLLEHYVNDILPPWQLHPEINPLDMFWKMGKGEQELSRFTYYYNSLNNEERRNLESQFPEPRGWAGFYNP